MLIVNGIYTFQGEVHVVMDANHCLCIPETDILPMFQESGLCNHDVCNYISRHYHDFTMFDIIGIKYLKPSVFKEGFLGVLNETAAQDFERFKMEWK